ncbi:unnamed protein product, partial [Mesorhabditis belari]|uniref:IBB domain-containing protein n=1 Tax=Mesorhabditis belari TaxID=2138241 RepID=A0AAF3EW38_9BILA
MDAPTFSGHSELYKGQSETTSTACVRRRRERTCELRKLKREQLLLDRRKIDTEQFLAAVVDNEVPNPLVSISRVQHLLRGDAHDRLEACRLLSYAMKENEQQSVHQLAELHLLPILTDVFLSSEGELQQQTGWILLNLARIPENFLSYNSQLDVLRSFFQLATVCYEAMIVADSMETVLPQLFVSLGLFAGKHIGNAMYTLNCKSVTELILSILHNYRKYTSQTLSSTVWLCTQLYRYAETDSVMYESEVHISLLQALVLLLEVNEKSILTDTVLCLMNAVWSEQLVQVTYISGALKRLLELSLEENDVSTYALHTISNVIENYGRYTDALINYGLIDVIYASLLSSNRCDDGCHILACVCAEGKEQISKVFSRDELIDRIYDVFTTASFDKRKEICAALSSASEMGSPTVREKIVQRGFLSTFCSMLDSSDINTVICVLIALDALLEFSEVSGVDTVRETIESCQGLERLLLLHDHENIDIMVKSQEIYDRYFAPYENDYREDFADVKSTMDDLLNIVESTHDEGNVWNF